MDKFAVEVLSDEKNGDARHLRVKTCDAVCSSMIDIDVQGDVVRKIAFTKGCHGNTQGIAALCAGMKVDDVIAKLSGIDCRGRGTSCPDQLARALSKC